MPTQALGTTRDPGGMSTSAPHEPRLGLDIMSAARRRRGDHRPNNEHVPTQRLADFAYKEIRVGEPHTSTHDRDRDPFVSSSDRREPPLRGEFKRCRGFVQVVCYDQSSRWGSHRNLRRVDTNTRRRQRKDSNIQFCSRLHPP